MFIRDPYTTETYQQAGPYTSYIGSTPAEDQAALKTLHALALSIYQAQQDVLAAQGRGDVAYVQKRLQDVSTLRNLLAQKSAQFVTSDTGALGALDRFILGTGTWVEQSLKALPGAIAFIPKAIIDALADIAQHAGIKAIGVSIPLFLLGGALLYFIFQAEKSSTIRAGTKAALL